MRAYSMYKASSNLPSLKACPELIISRYCMQLALFFQSKYLVDKLVYKNKHNKQSYIKQKNNE